MTDQDDLRIEPGMGGDEPPLKPAESFAARLPRLPRVRVLPLVAGAVLVAAAWGLWTHPPFKTVPNGDIGVRMSRLSGGAVVVHPGTAFVFPGLHDPAHLRPARADLPAHRQRVGRRQRAVPVGGRTVARRRRGGALRARSGPHRHHRPRLARRRRRRSGGARRARRDLPRVHPLHRQGDLLDQARRDPAGDRGRAAPAAGRQGHRAARRADRQGRPAARLQARHGSAAGRGARQREDAVHAGAQGQGSEAGRARSRGRQGQAREGRRGRRPGTDHRGQGAGRGDGPRAAVQGKADQAAPARGRGRQGVAHQDR